MQYIKQNTSGKIFFGPIPKSTDGYNPLVNIGTAAATAAIMFNYGSSSTGDMTTAHSWEEIANGVYLLGLASNAIGTLGHLRCSFKDSSGLLYYEDVRILSANQYDALVSTSDYLLVDIQQLGGSSAEIATGMFDVNVQYIGTVTVTTDAGDNFDNFFFDNDAQSTVRLSELEALLTTADSVNIGAVAGTTVASATAFRSTFSTAANVDIGAVAGTTVASATAFRSTFSTAALVNVGAINSATVATGTAQLGVNVVTLSSHAITSDAGDNFDRFFDNGGGVSTEVIGDLPTTEDILTTASNVNVGAAAGSTIAGATAFRSTFSTAALVDVGAMAGEAVTTDAADNWDNFWFNNDVVSTERIGEIPTTADLLTTASNVNVGAAAGTTIPSSTFFKADLTNISTFNPASNVVDVFTYDETMKYMQSYLAGDFKVTGAATNEIVYDDHGGTTLFQHVITTVSRTFSS